jgi:plastocyanin
MFFLIKVDNKMHTHYKRVTFMAMVVMTTVLTMITMFAPLLVNQTSSSAFAITANRDAPVKVQAGGGNGTAPLTQFLPERTEIKAGQSITWYNPTTVGEPHTVTFVLDNITMTGVVSPLAVPNSTQFTPLPPGSNNQPAMVPGKNIVIALNARVYRPTVIDSQGNVKMFAPPDANYTMTGTEKYVNSGWFLPKGQEKQYPGSGNTFTVTFEKPGTYKYICLLHPWMTGSVLVK